MMLMTVGQVVSLFGAIIKVTGNNKFRVEEIAVVVSISCLRVAYAIASLWIRLRAARLMRVLSSPSWVCFDMGCRGVD